MRHHITAGTSFLLKPQPPFLSLFPVAAAASFPLVWSHICRRKALQAEQGKADMEARIKQLEAEKKDLERQVQELKAKAEAIEKREGACTPLTLVICG